MKFEGCVDLHHLILIGDPYNEIEKTISFINSKHKNAKKKSQLKKNL